MRLAQNFEDTQRKSGHMPKKTEYLRKSKSHIVKSNTETEKYLKKKKKFFYDSKTLPLVSKNELQLSLPFLNRNSSPLQRLKKDIINEEKSKKRISKEIENILNDSNNSPNEDSSLLILNSNEELTGSPVIKRKDSYCEIQSKIFQNSNEDSNIKKDNFITKFNLNFKEISSPKDNFENSQPCFISPRMSSEIEKSNSNSILPLQQSNLIHQGNFFTSPHNRLVEDKLFPNNQDLPFSSYKHQQIDQDSFEEFDENNETPFLLSDDSDDSANEKKLSSVAKNFQSFGSNSDNHLSVSFSHNFKIFKKNSKNLLKNSKKYQKKKLQNNTVRKIEFINNSSKKKNTQSLEKLESLDIFPAKKEISDFHHFKKINNKMNMEKYKLNVSDIKIEKKLDEGFFGIVYKAKIWQISCAVKTFKNISGNNILNEKFEQFEKELGLIVSLRHPNIVLFLGYLYLILFFIYSILFFLFLFFSLSLFIFIFIFYFLFFFFYFYFYFILFYFFNLF